MGVWMIKGMAISLGLTLMLELFMAMVWRVRTKRELLAVVLVNVLTNPIVVCSYYMVYLYPVISLSLLTVVMEVLAVTTEALLYQRFARRISHPWWFSISANLWSYFMGELINHL